MKKNIEQDAQFAAELYADATREKLANIYAKALLGAVDALKVSTDDVWEEYDSFVELCDSYPKFEVVLASVMVSVEEKNKILDEICGETSDVFTSFLRTLARRGRFEMLREIRSACRLMDDERLGRAPIKITTAAPISVETKNKLAAGLRKLVGGEPELCVEVDPEMIGGIVARVGDVVYDASIATQLKKVRQDMIDRSAHEIQSRRDSFRYPEGN